MDSLGWVIYCWEGLSVSCRSFRQSLASAHYNQQRAVWQPKTCPGVRDGCWDTPLPLVENHSFKVIAEKGKSLYFMFFIQSPVKWSSNWQVFSFIFKSACQQAKFKWPFPEFPIEWACQFHLGWNCYLSICIHLNYIPFQVHIFLFFKVEHFFILFMMLQLSQIFPLWPLPSARL